MKLRIVSLLAVMFVAGGVLSIKPAAEPVNIGEAIENMATNAQLWMQTIDTQFENKEQQLGNLRFYPDWFKAMYTWNRVLKPQLAKVMDKAALRFNIDERVRVGQLTAAQGKKEINELFTKMNKDMPREQELKALSDFLENFGKVERGEPQPLAREVRPEVVQPKPAHALRPVVVVDKQKIEVELQKLDADVKKFENDFQEQTSAVNAFSEYMMGVKVTSYFKTVNELRAENNAIGEFIAQFRNALRANDQEKIADLAAIIKNQQLQLEQINQKLNDSYTEMSKFFPR